MEQSMIFSFFGGVLQNGFDFDSGVDFDKVLLELIRWLLPISVCLLAEGACLEKRRKIELLLCCRYETVQIWWRQKYVKSLLYGMSVTAVLFIAAMAVDVIGAVDFSGEVWKVFLLWFAHIMTIMSFFLVLNLTKFRRFAPAILLMLEGVTFLAGFQSMRTARFMYGMWGMYFQSEWHCSEPGVSVSASLITEGVLLVLSYLTGRVLLKKTMLSE